TAITLSGPYAGCVLAASDDGGFYALATVAGDALDVEDVQRHEPSIVAAISLSVYRIAPAGVVPGRRGRDARDHRTGSVAVRGRGARHRGVQKSGFVFGEVGPGTRLTIAVEAPTTTHELSVAKLQ